MLVTPSSSVLIPALNLAEAEFKSGTTMEFEGVVDGERVVALGFEHDATRRVLGSLSFEMPCAEVAASRSGPPGYFSTDICKELEAPPTPTMDTEFY